MRDVASRDDGDPCLLIISYVIALVGDAQF